MQDVPKIVRARLQRATPATAEAHPDADLLTAFAERTLSGGERDHVLEHIALCADCREVVALALPVTETISLAASGSARTGWLSVPVLRWGVVAAGVVLLASVGILQYRQRQQARTLVATSLKSREQLADSAPQSPAPPPSATASEPVIPRAESKKRTEIGKPTEITKKMPSPVAVPPRAANSLAVSKPPADKQAHAPNAIFPRPEPMRRSTSVGAAHSATGGYGFTSRAGRISIGGPIAPRSDAEPAPADQLQGLSKAKPALDQAAPAFAPAPLLHAQPTLMKSPVDVRWTISASGGLQRSIDGGNTWLDVDIAVNDSTRADLVRRAQPRTTVEVSGAAVEVQTEANSDTKSETKSETKSQARMAAKSAPKPSALAGVKTAEAEPVPTPRTIFRAVSVTSNAGEVWAGGSGGALYHTWDGGNRWSRVSPSDAASTLTGDIIAIQFSNPRNGIVTTSTTEVWTTLDAGQTWHKQK